MSPDPSSRDRALAELLAPVERDMRSWRPDLHTRTSTSTHEGLVYASCETGPAEDSAAIWVECSISVDGDVWHVRLGAGGRVEDRDIRDHFELAEEKRDVRAGNVRVVRDAFSRFYASVREALRFECAAIL